MRIDHEIKEGLARELRAILQDWPARQVVDRVGIHLSRVSELRNGKLRGYSIARLVRWLDSLGYEIDVIVRPRKRRALAPPGPAAAVVRHDQFGRPVPQSRPG